MPVSIHIPDTQLRANVVVDGCCDRNIRFGCVRKERKVVSYLHCNTTRSVYLLQRCAVVVVRGLRLIQPAPAVRLPPRCVPTSLLVGAVIEILDLAVVRKERKVVSYLDCNTTRSVYLLRRCAVVVVRGLRLNQPAPAVRLPQRPELSLTDRPRADFQRHHHDSESRGCSDFRKKYSLMFFMHTRVMCVASVRW